MSLPWTCTHCGTRHNSEEEETWCLRRRASVRRFTIAISVALSVTVLGVMIFHAVLVYGDWACAFAECRKVISR